MIARLNPIITGWAAYYRIGVSKRAFGALDAHLWRLAWKWAKFSHPNKPRRWIIARYFGMVNPARQDKWVLGSRETGFYLRKFAWTKSSDTGWSPGGRPRTTPPSPGTGTSGDAAPGSRWTRPPGTCCAASAAGARSAGDCCCTPTTSPKAPGEWRQWHTATRKAIRKHAIASVMDLGTPDERAAHHLIRIHCRRRISSGTNPALLPGSEPPGLA